MPLPFYQNNPVAMGTQNPATVGMMRGMGIPSGPAPAPNMAVQGPNGQLLNAQDMQGQQGQGQQMDPAMLERIRQMMSGMGQGAFPGR